MHLFENCFRNCHTFYIMRPLQANYKLFPYSFRDQYFRGITKMRKRRYVWRVSREYVRHGCLGWVAVCGLWDGGSERRWKWRLKPEASLQHCLLLLHGHLLLTHTSGISFQEIQFDQEHGWQGQQGHRGHRGHRGQKWPEVSLVHCLLLLLPHTWSNIDTM